MAEAGDRTERATPKRREEARKHGQVTLSPELAPVAVLLAALLLVSWSAPAVVGAGRLLLGEWLAAIGTLGVAHEASLEAAVPLLGRTAAQVGALVVPFFLATAALGTAAVVAQVGWSVNPGLLLPDTHRLSPANGVRRILSLGGAVNMLKAVLKIGVVLGIAYHVLRALGGEVAATPGMTLEALLAFTGHGLHRLFLAMALALVVLGALDYLWQRWRFEQSLKMTRQEVKEEHKETEGDPQVKLRFRRAHREVAKRRMLAEVRRADLVLTNPVHVAVALRYRAEEMSAPRVLAKGAGELAEKIKDAARRAGVPIVERRALARALFRSVKLGAEIPPALYRAVAEILAYVYSLRSTALGEAR